MKQEISTVLISLVCILLVAACGAQPSSQPPIATSSVGGEEAEATRVPADAPTDAATSLEANDGGTQTMVDALTAPELPATWTPQGDLQLYDSESLYDLVNGQADEYFAYAFEHAAVRTFENAAGDTLRAA